MSEVELPKPWEIPATWAWQCIGDVCAVIGGATPDTSDPRNFDGGDVPWVTPADLSGYREKYIARGERNITKVGLDSSSARLLPKGSVLFSSRAPVGYVAIAERPLATNQGFKSFVPPAGVASDYLYYYLQRAKPLALELASGTTFQEVSGKRAAQIPFAIAPKQEQPRIVAKLEELFSDLDAGVAALERARTNLKRYRAAVLKAAVEGKLTEQWRKAHPDVETASKLLERILAERRRKWEEAQLAKFAAAGKTPLKGWKDKYPEPVKPDATDLHELPKGWCWATAEQLSDEARSITYGIVKLGKETLGGVPTLRSSNVRNLRLELDYVKPVSRAIANQYKRTFLNGGELLVTIRGTLGGIAVASETCRGFNVSREVAVVALVDTTIAYTLAYLVASDLVQKWITRNTRGIAYTGINIGTLKELPVPLAPLPEMLEIRAEVEEKLSYVEPANESLITVEHRTARLRQAILKRAFEGKLVSQDPNDEPASVLLERIRAMRVGTEKNSRRTRRISAEDL